MASGIVRRAMVYLGLVDDDYEDYEAYEEPMPAGGGRSAARPIAGGAETGGRGLPGRAHDPARSAATRPAAA